MFIQLPLTLCDILYFQITNILILTLSEEFVFNNEMLYFVIFNHSIANLSERDFRNDKYIKYHPHKTRTCVLHSHFLLFFRYSLSKAVKSFKVGNQK